MEQKNVTEIIIITTVTCLALFVIEQLLDATYIAKSLAKIALFLIAPLFYIKFILKQSIIEQLNLRSFDWKRLRLGFTLGLTSMAITLVTFLLLRSFINTDDIMDDLQARLQITPEIFVFVALYITFGNSLLEEFYFRGFIFLNLYKKNHKALAYLYSAGLFAIYHVAIFAVWFNIWLIMLALLGLFIVGLVFNWLNTKSHNFLNSWVLHILADIGVMIIGFHLFGFF